jgi:predicted nucleic acid-binding protein
MLVADASVALKWFKSEPDSHLAEAVVAAEDIIAPELLLAELTNACWSAAGRGMLTPAQVAGALRHYLTLLHLIAPLARRAVHIALTLDHPACDCFYLARAEREAVPLVTADRRLIARLTGTAWAGIVIDLATYTLRP